MLRYEIEKFGPSPITLDLAKGFMKVTSSADDNVINQIIAAVTIAAETHTGRQLRANKWFAYADDFQSKWELRKQVVEIITSVMYIKDGSTVIVANTVYELKKKTWYADLKLSDGQSWPTDVDPISDAVLISFNTVPDPRLPDIILHMQKHISFLYENRGDDEPFSSFIGSQKFRDTEFYTDVSIPSF